MDIGVGRSKFIQLKLTETDVEHFMMNSALYECGSSDEKFDVWPWPKLFSKVILCLFSLLY